VTTCSLVDSEYFGQTCCLHPSDTRQTDRQRDVGCVGKLVRVHKTERFLVLEYSKFQ